MKLNETTGLYENYGLWHVPFWQTHKFHLMVKISCIVLVLLVIAFFIKKYYDYKKRKKLSVADQALLDLRTLKSEHKVSVAHGKEFYVTVSTIIKKYLNEQFGFDVLSKTDAEVVQYLQEQHAEEQMIEEIKIVLHGSLIIKFANAQAAQAHIDNDYVRALGIIQRTIPAKK